MFTSSSPSHESNSASSDSTKLRLQIIVTDETRFLTIADANTLLSELRQNIESEYAELYKGDFPLEILRLQDSFHNDMPLRYKAGELLKDMDKIYTVLKPPPVEAEVETPASLVPVNAPKRRGRKRKNAESSKDTPKAAKTQSNGIDAHAATSLTIQQQIPPNTPNSQQQRAIPPPSSSSLSSQIVSSTTVGTKVPSVTIIPSVPAAYTPVAAAIQSAVVPTKESPKEERVQCTPHCQVAETRDKVTICTRCGELRPYVMPESEKLEKAHCSRWCVSSAGRKTRANGFEYCSICIARHRAGKYPLKGGSHQCAGCHRPWLQIDEADLCRTCRKGDSATKKSSDSTNFTPLTPAPAESDSIQDMLMTSPLEQEGGMISHDILILPPSSTPTQAEGGYPLTPSYYGNNTDHTKI